jgi:hypothetical protein
MFQTSSGFSGTVGERQIPGGHPKCREQSFLFITRGIPFDHHALFMRWEWNHRKSSSTNEPIRTAFSGAHAVHPTTAATNAYTLSARESFRNASTRTRRPGDGGKSELFNGDRQPDDALS